MVCTSPTPCSRFGSIGSIAYDASLRQGVCLTISVTKSDQITISSHRCRTCSLEIWRNVSIFTITKGFKLIWAHYSLFSYGHG